MILKQLKSILLYKVMKKVYLKRASFVNKVGKMNKIIIFFYVYFYEKETLN